MADKQTAAPEGGRCGIRDLAEINKPQTTISSTIFEVIRHSENGETALAAAFRAALAKKAGRTMQNAAALDGVVP